MVSKNGIKCFGLKTPKFLINTTNMITRKLESNVLVTGRPEWATWPENCSNNMVKIFHQHDVIDDKKVAIKCFRAQEKEMSLRPSFSSNHRHQNFPWTRGTWSLESWNQMFWAKSGKNEPNDRKIVPIDVIKSFHEHDVNDVKQVGIKCYWAQDIKIFHEHDEHDQ